MPIASSASMKNPDRKPDHPVENIIDSFRRTGTGSGETGGPENNGPDVDYSDMGNVNVYNDQRDEDDEEERKN